MKEKELRPIVEQWFANRGYRVAHECLMGEWCDMIGSRWTERIGRAKPKLVETMAVELKIRDIAGVIRQAENNHHHCTYSFAAMPMDFCKRMILKSWLKFHESSVGLIVVDKTYARIVVSSVRKTRLHSKEIERRLWSYYLRHRNDSVKSTDKPN